MKSVCIIGATLPSLALASELSLSYDVAIFESKNSTLSIDSHSALSSLKLSSECIKTTLNEGFGGTSELWTGGLVRSIDSDRRIISATTLEALYPIAEALIQLDSDTRIDETGYSRQSTFVLDTPLRGSLIPLRKSIKVHLNSKVTSISKLHGGKSQIRYIRKDTSSIQDFDICIIAAGTLGTLSLLRSSSLITLPEQLKLSVHPKFSVGCIILKRPVRLEEIMGDYCFFPSGYMYSRYLLPESSPTSNHTFSHALRFSSKRTRLLTRLLRHTPRHALCRNLCSKSLQALDSVLVPLLKNFPLNEKVDIELFINDYRNPSYVTSDGQKISIADQSEYVSRLFNHVDTFCKAHFKNNILKQKLSLKKSTLLHSHLCSSLWEYREDIQSLEEQNIYCLSASVLPPGYYNPMYELLNLATQICQDLCRG